jgi:hypothetical protein
MDEAIQPTRSQKPVSRAITETPGSIQDALRSAQASSKELILSSKSLLQTTDEAAVFQSSKSQSATESITTLAKLIHSHIVRTALTCGPTASSPSATLSCIKDLHKPILPIISECQNLRDYPTFFITTIHKNVSGLLDALILFIGEVVDIACGKIDVESPERLQYSGMTMEICDRIQRVCQNGPIRVLRDKLRETSEMMNDALTELVEVIEDKDVQDGCDRPEYTFEQISFAQRLQKKLGLISILYKAILKRRITEQVPFRGSIRNKLDTIRGCLNVLEEGVDDLVAGISMQEEPMSLELSLVGTIDEAMKLAKAVRVPLNDIADGKEAWFDNWMEKLGVRHPRDSNEGL